MPTHVRYVVERFPRQAERVAALAAEDEEFRSLCDDYDLVAETLGRLEARGEDRDDEMISEYHAYLLELERDIAAALTNAAP